MSNNSNSSNVITITSGPDVAAVGNLSGDSPPDLITQSPKCDPPTNNATDREKELQARLVSLETDRIKFIESVRNKLRAKDLEVQKVYEENEQLKKKIADQEATVLHSINKSKKLKSTDLTEDEDMLAKAKALLFERTKICKQQELQIEALTNQVAATKEVLDITKDMVNLKNIESDHCQGRLESAQLRNKAQKEQHQLTEKRLIIAKKMYDDLKAEYDVQSGIFKDLRKAYEEKITLLTKQLKEAREVAPSTS